MSPDEFRELLQTKGVSAACPVCDAEDWRGLDDVIDLPVRMTGPTPSESHVRIPGFEALAPSCGRCGNVRLIDLRWLQAPAHQQPGSEQGCKPAPDVESTDPDQPKRSGLRSEPLTNIWGQPIQRPGGKPR